MYYVNSLRSIHIRVVHFLMSPKALDGQFCHEIDKNSLLLNLGVYFLLFNEMVKYWFWVRFSG